MYKDLAASINGNSNVSLLAFSRCDTPQGKLLREISPWSYFVFAHVHRLQPAVTLQPQTHPFNWSGIVNKTTVSQVVRGVSGFISWFNAAAGPLNSQRSDHSGVRSLTPHHFIHSLIQEHI